LIGAEANFRKAIDILRWLPQRNEVRKAIALLNLGDLLLIEDKDEEAIGALREADAIFQKQGDTFFSATSTMYLCKADWKSGDYNAAITAGTKGIEAGRKLHLEELVDFVYTLEYLGMSLTRAAKAREAEPLAREALARAQKLFSDDPGRVAIAEGTVGECLIGQDRFAEAEPLIVHSYDVLETTPGRFSYLTPSGNLDPFKKWRTLARARAIELYEKWKKPDRAARYEAGR
jgi:tetratricopeptide (TPR) repeat protein